MSTFKRRLKKAAEQRAMRNVKSVGYIPAQIKRSIVRACIRALERGLRALEGL